MSELKNCSVCRSLSEDCGRHTKSYRAICEVIYDLATAIAPHNLDRGKRDKINSALIDLIDLVIQEARQHG